MNEDAAPDERATALRNALARSNASIELRRLSFLTAVLRCYREIDGGTSETVLSVTLFTTVLQHLNGFFMAEASRQ